MKATDQQTPEAADTAAQAAADMEVALSFIEARIAEALAAKAEAARGVPEWLRG